MEAGGLGEAAEGDVAVVCDAEAFARQEPAQDVRLENLTAVRSGSDAGGGDDGGAGSGSPDQDEDDEDEREHHPRHRRG